jgi:hypothetical protein
MTHQLAPGWEARTERYAGPDEHGAVTVCEALYEDRIDVGWI